MRECGALSLSLSLSLSNELIHSCRTSNWHTSRRRLGALCRSVCSPAIVSLSMCVCTYVRHMCEPTTNVLQVEQDAVTTIQRILVHKLDPISLRPIRTRFMLWRHSVHIVYDAHTLITYITTSGDTRDPVAREELVTHELMRLARLGRTKLPSILDLRQLRDDVLGMHNFTVRTHALMTHQDSTSVERERYPLLASWYSRAVSSQSEIQRSLSLPAEEDQDNQRQPHHVSQNGIITPTSERLLPFSTAATFPPPRSLVLPPPVTRFQRPSSGLALGHQLRNSSILWRARHNVVREYALHAVTTTVVYHHHSADGEWSS